MPIKAKADWKDLTPESLLAAVEKIRSDFEEQVWRWKELTSACCTAKLRPNAITDKTAEYQRIFEQNRHKVGKTAEIEFERLRGTQVAPAVFTAYLWFFRCALSATLLRYFLREFLLVAEANVHQIGMDPLPWAEEQMRNLVVGCTATGRSWILDVLVGWENVPFEDPLKFRVPKLICMKPSGNVPYAPELAWQLQDEEWSAARVKTLAENFSLHLDIALQNLVDECHVAAAKAPQQPHHSVAPHDPANRKQPTPLDYPHQITAAARARLEAAKIRASRKHQQACASGPVRQRQENLRKYILEVFEAFGKEAIALFQTGIWPADKVRAEATEFLRIVTIHLYYEVGNGLPEMVSHWTGGLLQDVKNGFRTSAEWQDFEDALLQAIENPQIKHAMDATASELGTSRKKLIEDFLERCNAKFGKPKLVKKHIWKAAGHSAPRQFQYWQAEKHRSPGETTGATASDDDNFSRILRMDPQEFRQLLIDKKMLRID